MIDEAVSSKLDRALGRLDAIIASQTEQGSQLDQLGERMVLVERGVCDTKDVVAAWTATKTSMRFIKWWAGFLGIMATMVGAVVAAYFTIKQGMSK